MAPRLLTRFAEDFEAAYSGRQVEVAAIEPLRRRGHRDDLEKAVEKRRMHEVSIRLCAFRLSHFGERLSVAPPDRLHAAERVAQLNAAVFQPFVEFDPGNLLPAPL